MNEKNKNGWISFTSDSIESLPPEQQELARKALAEYEAREPLAEITVRVFRLERGGSEVRFKTQTPEGTRRAEWYEKVARIVADEVIDAGETLGTP